MKVTFLFLSEVYDLFPLLCELSSVFICFSPEVIFRSRVIGACPVTTDCIVAIEQQQRLFGVKPRGALNLGSTTIDTTNCK